MFVVVLVATVLVAPSAHAAIFRVAWSNDAPGSCSGTHCSTVRAALAAAELSPGADTILLPDGDLWLDAPLILDTDVTLEGEGADKTFVHGDDQAYRALEVMHDATVTVAGMTLADGYAPGASGEFQAGGVVRNYGTLTLDRVRVTRGRGSSGGGVANTGGVLTITRSLIDDNVADLGGGDAGGLLNHGGGTVTVSDTTIAHNTANKDAAFLSWGGPNTTTFVRVTVVGNIAGAETGGIGHSAGDTVVVRGSIIADNLRGNVPSNCLLPVTSGGGNVTSGEDCQLTHQSDLQSTDPMLSRELESLGGGTRVFALEPGSPALDRFDCDDATDQRGVTRPQGGSCDAGAYEHDPVRITSAPEPFTNDPRAFFTFTAPQGPESRCRLVGYEDVETGCSSPRNYQDLPDGSYVFRVRAVLDNQTVGLAEHAFTIDTEAPAVPVITSPQDGATVHRLVIAGTAEPLSTVWVRESRDEGSESVQADENGNWAIHIDRDGSGEQRYSVRAQDRARNYSPDSATVSVVVQPTTIDSGPEGPTNDPTPTFTFSSVGGADFECSLNGAPFAACSSPHTVGPLEQGTYVFAVRASPDEEPTTRSFTVDLEEPARPEISSPRGPVLQTTRSVALEGTHEAGTSIELYDGASLVGQGVPDPELVDRWTARLDGLTGGQHVLTARAVDPAGNRSEPSAPVTVTVAVARFTSGPDGPDHSFAFTSDPSGVSFACRLGTGAFEPCTSPKSFPGLATGTYRFEVVAMDGQGRFDATLATARQFTVDATAPAPPALSVAVEGGAATVAITAAEAGLRFECRLEGPGRVGAFEACVPGQRYAGLTPGDYRLSVRAIDAAGNTSQEAQRSFTVAAPQPMQPTPTATPSPAPPVVVPTPTPEKGETVVVRPTRGTVKIRLPGSKTFTELQTIDDLPLGATIDTKAGRIQLRFESAPGKVQIGTFYGGIFTVRQIGKVLDLKLSETLAPCPKRKGKGKASGAPSKKKKPKKRKLWGDGKGSFRTSGKHSAATVRGTRWLVEDSCAGTLTRVTQGVVSVRHGKKTVLLRAGKKYLAKPRR